MAPVDSRLQIELMQSIPASNRDRERVVFEQFEQVDCDQLERQWVNARDGDNLICTIEGGKSDRRLLIGAHYDTVPNSAGVADNWSGIAVLVSLAQHFSRHRPSSTLEFVAFAGEERDLLGARAYIYSEREKPAVMVNLDTLGLSPMAYDPRSDPSLRCLAASQGLGPSPWIKDLTGDWEVFARHGVPILALHSIQPANLRLLHSRRDRRSIINDDELISSYRTTLELARQLDQASLR